MAQTNYHLTQRVEHYGVSVDSARAAVVLLHGRDHSPEYMDEYFVQRLGGLDIAFVAPQAANNSWYPKSFLDPVDENQPGLDFSIDLVSAIVANLDRQNVASEKIVFCGFSQGACIASHFVANYPRRWGGLIALTGGLVGPQGTAWNISPDFGGMPAYFCTSDIDPFVPEYRVRESAKALQAAGADVTVDFFVGRQHEICAAEISQAKLILAKF